MVVEDALMGTACPPFPSPFVQRRAWQSVRCAWAQCWHWNPVQTWFWQGTWTGAHLQTGWVVFCTMYPFIRTCNMWNIVRQATAYGFIPWYYCRSCCWDPYQCQSRSWTLKPGVTHRSPCRNVHCCRKSSIAAGNLGRKSNWGRRKGHDSGVGCNNWFEGVSGIRSQLSSLIIWAPIRHRWCLNLAKSDSEVVDPSGTPAKSPNIRGQNQVLSLIIQIRYNNRAKLCSNRRSKNVKPVWGPMSQSQHGAPRLREVNAMWNKVEWDVL